jgi:diguanylate cyclase (GGDEF)-like protein
MYLQLDLYPVLMLLILYANSKMHLPYMKEGRLLRLVMLLLIATLVVDAFNWQLIGKDFHAAKDLLVWDNVIYFLLTGISAFTWFYYTHIKLYGYSALSGRIWLLLCVPLAALCIVSILTPWTRWLFYVDADAIYYRGNLFSGQVVVSFGYLLAAAVMALLRRKKESLRENRRECLYLASFVIFPIVGGVFQLLVYGFSLVWQFAALSILIVYINLRNRQITLDPLTGLNNRGQFDKYLHDRCSRAEKQHEPFLLLIDIDDFKSINDVFGHLTGDEALVQLANILKRTFNKSNAFLARYGGDEFAVVIPYEGDMRCEDLLEGITAEMLRDIGRLEVSYHLSLSIGCARYDIESMNSAEQLIAAADKHMYIQKKAHKHSEKHRK